MKQKAKRLLMLTLAIVSLLTLLVACDGIGDVQADISITPGGSDNQSDQNTTTACSHVLLHTNPVEPTCTDGNIEYWICTKCAKIFSDAEATDEITAKQIVLAATDSHTLQTDPSVAPTYDSDGLTEGSHCSVCGLVMKAQDTIPKLEIGYYSISYNNLKGAESPTVTRYAENEGVSPENMPIVTSEGYVFKGWYTASEGGELIEYIDIGNKKNYTLFARWDTVKYSITYIDAPENSNQAEYTIEDEIVLSPPSWTGLVFSHWTDESGNTLTKINKGTTGNINVTAHWTILENFSVSSDNEDTMMIYNEARERYYFIVPLGTISNIPLGNLCVGQYKYPGAELTWTVSETVSFSESVAESVSKTISKVVTQSQEWSKAMELTQGNTVTSNVSSEIGADIEGISAKVSASVGTSSTVERAYSKTNIVGESEENEESHSASSTVSYDNTISTTITISKTISPEMPEGTYTLAYVGKVYVYAIVTYDNESKNYYLDLYSYMDDAIVEMPIYTPPAQSTADITSAPALSYSIDTEEISAYVSDAYYVEYDANGGVGEMPTSLMRPGVDALLYPNEFTKTGYKFVGWKLQSDDTSELYANEASICDLAAKGETVTLYAHWTPVVYSIEYNTNGGLLLSGEAYPQSYTVEDLPLELPRAVYNEYPEYNHFIEWQENGQSLSDSIKTDPRNLILTASWDLCAVYSSIDSTPWSPDERVIFDWRNADNTDFAQSSRPLPDWAAGRNSDMDIYSGDRDIYIIGDPNKTYYNLRLILAKYESDSPLTIHLINFNLETKDNFICESETEHADLIIKVSGNCSLKTTKTENVIHLPNVNITFTGSGNLTIEAGDGSSSTGGDGEKGAIAISANNVTVDMQGSITVYGGDGGDAYDRSAGDNSGNCSDGRDGYTGGAGASALSAKSVTILSGTCKFVGGNGGEGGNGSEGNDCIWHTHYGGDGGNGGAGGTAIDSSSLTVNSGSSLTAEGGDGGNGGTRGGMHEEGAENAGSQGSGGAAGAGISSSCSKNISDGANTNIVSGSAGSEGEGTNYC